MLAAGVLAVRAQETAPPPPEEQIAAPAAPVDPNAVVARVGDVAITEEDIAFAREAFEGELANVPEDQKRSVVIDAFVNMQLLAIGAREAGLDQTEDFAKRLEFAKLQALRNAYVRNEIMHGLTDQELQDGYKTLVVDQHQAEEEVHARHILVEKKEDADKIIEQLKAGEPFEELAKQSKDPTGQNGGDLGFFGRGQMVKPFEDAAFALEPGQVSETPVESQFGWHVIKVEEKRMSEPPTLEQVEEQLRNYLMRQKFEAVVAALREKYPVEIVGQEEEPAAPAPSDQPADQPPPADGSQN
jgi:peptidyl-prolyl cis-trans isomerase C